MQIDYAIGFSLNLEHLLSGERCCYGLPCVSDVNVRPVHGHHPSRTSPITHHPSPINHPRSCSTAATTRGSTLARTARCTASSTARASGCACRVTGADVALGIYQGVGALTTVAMLLNTVFFVHAFIADRKRVLQACCLCASAGTEGGRVHGRSCPTTGRQRRHRPWVARLRCSARRSCSSSSAGS